MADEYLAPDGLEFSRERIVEEIQRRFARKEHAANPADVERLFDKAAYVSNKANVLAGAISREAQKLFIPVPEILPAVRAAVKRTSADSPDGSRISWDLFRDAVEYMQKQRQEVEQVVMLSGHADTGQALSKRIQKVRVGNSLRFKGLNPADDLVEMLVSQFIILFLANQLMKPFHELEQHLPLALQRLPAGTEQQAEIPIWTNILVGLAIQLLIMGLEEAAMETYMKQAAGDKIPKGIDFGSIIRQAKELSSHEKDLADLYVGLNDYQVILQFAGEFLTNTHEPGYEMWVAYLRVVSIRYSAQSQWINAPRYSVPHALVARNQKVGGRVSKTEEDSILQIKANEAKAILSDIVPMATISFLARDEILDKQDGLLDTIAQVLSSDFALGTICCFVSNIKPIPIDVLRATRGLMDGLLRASVFDARYTIRALIDHLLEPNPIETLANMVMVWIDEIFYRVTKRVTGFLGEEYERLLSCPLFGEMIRAVLTMLARTEAELKQAVRLYADKMIQSTSLGAGPVLQHQAVTYEQRILRKIILILDAVLEAGDIMVQCDNVWKGQPLPEQIRQAIQLPSVSLTPNEQTNYFTSAGPKLLENGKYLPAIGEYIQTTVLDPLQATVDPEKKHFCGRSTGDAPEKAAESFQR